MGKYRHGSVHKRPKVWRSQKENRKKDEERIRQNREILAACKKELQA